MNKQREIVRKQLAKLEGANLRSSEYRERLLAELRRTLPFTGACCTLVDPQTMLSTGAVTEEGVEAIHHLLFEYEYLREDFNSYEELAKLAVPVATLSGATEGDLSRSFKYMNVLQPAGFGDELRAALTVDGACWGYLTLFRMKDEPFFQEEERLYIASLVPSMARTLKKASLLIPDSADTAFQDDPGILILSEQLLPLASNDAANSWLSELREWEYIDAQTLPRPVRAVCSRALAASAADKELQNAAKVCIRIPDGPYLSLRASKLHAADHSVQLAVWFELAKPGDILPIIAEAYGLTSREKQLVERLWRGLSTKELASSLHISSYTVQDHLKAIFAKTEVSSRRELIWKLFSRYNLYMNE
ncbi:helix-turn-helix transcriptional regulator [Paenibacillus sp. KS-LC4]|uniref:helix-turn-helix transcriptional regulator n=1 Tax=Paenibacillus sp. KS-LC4 TaxID=2979727 RepID=UPI0030D41A32